MKKISILTVIALILSMLLVPTVGASAATYDGYMLPRNGSNFTYLMDDGRLFLGIQYRTGGYKVGDVSGTASTTETFVNNYPIAIKESIYINGIQLSEALEKDPDNVTIQDIGTAGWIQIKIRYADKVTQAPYENPFGIKEGDGVAFQFKEGPVGDYNVGPTNAYWTWGSTWKAINGVKYAALRNTVTTEQFYFPDNLGKYNLTFNIRDGKTISTPGFDIGLTAADVEKIAKVTELNGINYFDNANGDTVKYSCNSTQQYSFQFRVGAGSAGNPFGVESAESGTLRYTMTTGVLTNNNYYIPAYDYVFDFANKTISDYVPSVDESKRNLTPNDAEAHTGPSETEPDYYHVWFNVRNTTDSSTVKDYLVITDENFAGIKDNLYINGVKLADAMQNDPNVTISVPNYSETGNGQFSVKFKYKDGDSDFANPFGIYESTKGYRVELKNTITLTFGAIGATEGVSYNIYPIDYYYTASTAKFAYVKGEAALVPHASSENRTKDGRAIVKFYLRNSTDNKTVNITATADDLTVLRNALYLNGQKLMSGICTNVTTASNANGYVQLNMYIFGENENMVGITETSGFRLSLKDDIMISGYLVHGFDKFCTLTNTPGEAEFSDFIRCIDVNGDRVFDIVDLVRLKKIISKSESFDVNLDGVTNAQDLTIVRAALLGVFDTTK